MFFLHAVCTVGVVVSSQPEMGTYLEPWYTARSSYRWTVPALPAAAAAGPAAATAPDAIFADVNGDGKDDLLLIAEGSWFAALSDGTSSWRPTAVWWEDTISNLDAERFAADLDGDGAADAATFSAGEPGHPSQMESQAVQPQKSAPLWLMAFSNNTSFRNQERVSPEAAAIMGCDTSTHRAVSHGALWCIGSATVATTRASTSTSTSARTNVNTNATSVLWGKYDVVRKTASSQKLALPPDAGAVVQVWVVQTTSNATIEDAVVIDEHGNLYRARNTGRGEFAPFQLVLRNFTASRGASCGSNSRMMLAPYSAVGAGSTPSTALVCADATSGYWYAAPVSPDGSNVDAPISIWKYSHGGAFSSIRAPSTSGYAQQQQQHPQSYQSFYIGCPFGSLANVGEPSAIACNFTVQGEDKSAGCMVMPPNNPDYFDHQQFQSKAPNLKSTNINLWDAWRIDFSPLLHSGEFGVYDSADLVQARYMFDKLADIGISYFITDNTNGLGCDFGNTLAATKTLAAFAARYNAEPDRQKGGGKGKMFYSLSVGVNPLGPATDPATLAKMDNQLQDVWNMFMNTTDAAAAAIDGNADAKTGANAAALAGAAYKHPITGKPLIILYVEPSFEYRYGLYLKSLPETAIGNRFHIGYSDGNNWRAGLYGWMIDRSCGPPNTPDNPCNETGVSPHFDTGVRPSNDTMYISPSYAKVEEDPAGPGTYHTYGARDLGWYASQFPVVEQACPTLLIVGAFNDYTEMNGWWPSKCPECNTGEELDPYLFWNATVEGLAQVRKACRESKGPSVL